jgi:hypothetical protein
MPTNIIEDVRPGEIISSIFINSLLDTLRNVEGRVATLESSQPGGGTPALNIVSGLVEKSAFTLSNVPGSNPKSGDQSRATSLITHGLGSAPVAVIIGLEDFGENPAAPNFERAVDRYYSVRDTGISGSTFQLLAEVTKPYNGTFKLFTNVGTMEFFDRLRWWAIK